MSDLLSLLALFYACDVAAETRFPSPQEWVTCMGHYHAVKTHFAGGATDPEGQMAGYLLWKAWEDENAALVAEMRAAVR